MKQAVIVAIVVVLLVGGAGIYYLLRQAPAPATQSTGSFGTPSTVDNTTGVSTGGTGTGTPKPTLTVAATVGDPIVVNDFTKDSATATSGNIPGHYFISGGLDPYGTGADFSTYFATKDQSFTITILAEPIADVRKEAEQELMQKLGINQVAMCRLRYNVSVPTDVNGAYAGKNLGFSFCPGATAL